MRSCSVSMASTVRPMLDIRYVKRSTSTCRLDLACSNSPIWRWYAPSTCWLASVTSASCRARLVTFATKLCSVTSCVAILSSILATSARAWRSSSSIPSNAPSTSARSASCSATARVCWTDCSIQLVRTVFSSASTSRSRSLSRTLSANAASRSCPRKQSCPARSASASRSWTWRAWICSVRRWVRSSLARSCSSRVDTCSTRTVASSAR
mmetsp:Transcript_8729/g.24636  ORF Transcript_8729/g.24636 Transcript_8729/m.24636 type:complete len:210 (+) Transcript_8729:39-668(+)